MEIRLEEVVAGYGFGDVLRGIDLVAPSGEITCLIGPNGAGKSAAFRRGACSTSALCTSRRSAACSR